MEIKLIITDFDGTLVDTFEANYQAYEKVFGDIGIKLSRDKYKQCFGFRFDRFMEEMGVEDSNVKLFIKEEKAKIYPQFFNLLKINDPLLNFIRSIRKCGGKTVIASTARRKNLINVLDFIGAKDDFDLILSGENVKKGKPEPEIYLRALEEMKMKADEAIVFEDSEVGIMAAQEAGINYIKITF